MPSKHACFLLVLAGFASASCSLITTKEEGRELDRKLNLLAERTAKIESELVEERAHLTEMIDKARSDLEKLEETLTRATRVLARDTADYGAEIEGLKKKLGEVDGAIAELNHALGESSATVVALNEKLEGFAVAAGLDLPVDESKVPRQAKDHFKMIEDSFAAGRFGETRSLSTLFLDRYPKDGNADKAAFYAARAYLEQKRWAKALGVLREFTDKYPKSALLPEALFEMARSFFALGDCTDARILVETLTTTHKKSPFAPKAKQLGDDMQKNKLRCTS